jgi:uncharacterized protein
VLGAGWTEAVALAAAFTVSAIATPAGISGAVLLLPFQVSVLGTPSPAVTPTNLLYNVVSTPGALYRYRRQHQTGGRLALILITGTLPGVIAGSVIRVELVPGPRVFDLLVAALLLPLGIWLAVWPGRSRDPARTARPRRIPAPALVVLACLTGGVGGIYGIGGRDPVARLDRFRPPGLRGRPGRAGLDLRDRPRGVVTFTILSISEGPVAPDVADRFEGSPRLSGLAFGLAFAARRAGLPAAPSAAQVSPAGC